MYTRTKEQNASLGICDEENNIEEEKGEERVTQQKEEKEEEEESELSLTEDSNSEAKDDPESIKDEVLVFSTLCDRCSRPASTNMKVTKIPHFKVSV